MILNQLELGSQRGILGNKPEKNEEMGFKNDYIPSGFNPDLAGFYNPTDSRFSENPLFDKEIKVLMTRLNDECGKYMTFKEMGKIDLAMALMHYGHQNHTRKDKSKSPYVYHLLRTAIYLAEKFQMDWESIAAGLCHDVLEDSGKYGHPVTFEDLANLLSADVARTVKTLSKVRFIDTKTASQELIKQVDRETREEIYKSIEDNPRAAIIKIIERLDNMREVGYLTEVNRKRNSYETLKYWVPFAQILGLFDEARELASISLKEIDPEFTKKLENVLNSFEHMINQPKAESDGMSYLELLKEKICETLKIPERQIRVLIPDIFSIYRKIGKIRDPKPEDCFVVADIDLLYERSSRWFRTALDWEIDLGYSDEFNIGTINFGEMWKDFKSHRLNSVEFFMQSNLAGNINVKVNIYPKGGFELVQIPITDYYFRRTNGIKGDSEIKKKHASGKRKWDYIKELSGKGDVGKKIVENALPGKIEIFYKNKKGEVVTAYPENNSNIIDFAVDEFPLEVSEKPSWQNVRSFRVSRGTDAETISVNPDFKLQPGDLVEVEFAQAKTIKPEWILALETSSEEIKNDIRNYFRGLLDSENMKETADEILHNWAVELMSKKMGETLHVKLQKSEYFSSLGFGGEEYIYKIALEEANEEDLDQIAKELKEYQDENLVQMKFNFSEDNTGIIELVARAFTKRNISVRRSAAFAGAADEAEPRMTVVMDLNNVYKKKEDFPKIFKLVDEIIGEIRITIPTLIQPSVHYPRSLLPFDADVEF